MCRALKSALQAAKRVYGKFNKDQSGTVTPQLKLLILPDADSCSGLAQDNDGENRVWSNLSDALYVQNFKLKVSRSGAALLLGRMYKIGLRSEIKAVAEY